MSHGGDGSATRRVVRPGLVMPAIAAGLVMSIFLAYLLLSYPFDSDFRARDVEAYWTAAERLRAGLDPYATRVLPYTYAPWFAYLWIPLTFLPRELVEWAWLALLLGCAAWLSYPLLWSFTGLLVALLVVPQVIEYAWIGNVDALMLSGLALLHTRAGPVFVGLAASLKITPIAFVAYYLLRREWTRAAIAVGVGAALWLPIVMFDVSTFGDAGYEVTTPYSLMTHGTAVWVLGNGIVVAAVAWIGWRSRRYALLACAVAAMLANPRLNLYNLGYLTVPAREASAKR